MSTRIYRFLCPIERDILANRNPWELQFLSSAGKIMEVHIDNIIDEAICDVYLKCPFTELPRKSGLKEDDRRIQKTMPCRG